MTFCVIGDDERQKSLALLLAKKGIEVLPIYKAMQSDNIIFPTPLRKESELYKAVIERGYSGSVFAGAISAEEKRLGSRLQLYDYADDEIFALQNALPSAEGALHCIMSRRTTVLLGSTVAILGYGRIAKLLAKMLDALGCTVTIVARKQTAQAEARSFGFNSCCFNGIKNIISDLDILVNTVPSPVIDRNVLSAANPKIYLLDLASAPGGIPQQEAEACELNVEWVPGLPAIYSPETAAEYVVKSLENLLGGKL